AGYEGIVLRGRLPAPVTDRRLNKRACLGNKMTARNVLVTCGGTAVGTGLQLKQALRDVPPLRDGEGFVAGRAALTPASYFADAALVVPAVDHPSYVAHLLDLCRQHAVRVLIPIMDIDLDRLAPHLQQFTDQGTTVVCPSPRLVELCLDKRLF